MFRAALPPAALHATRHAAGALAAEEVGDLRKKTEKVNKCWPCVYITKIINDTKWVD